MVQTRSQKVHSTTTVVVDPLGFISPTWVYVVIIAAVIFVFDGIFNHRFHLPNHESSELSSVNFCEPDYFLSEYIAEFHNTWSSIVGISMFPFIALLYSNPTKEWRFTIMYLILMAVGIGSACLHATLLALPQSFDEVPMLWMIIIFLFALLENSALPNKPNYQYLPWIMFVAAVVQTGVYYTFMQYYSVFLLNYVSMVAVVTIWISHLANRNNNGTTTNGLSKKLWQAAIGSYLLIGTPLWIVEMNNCPTLLPSYKAFGGLSFHILWHLGAGLGTYLTILFLITLRMQTLYGEEGKLTYLFGFCPVVERTNNKKKK